MGKVVVIVKNKDIFDAWLKSESDDRDIGSYFVIHNKNDISLLDGVDIDSFIEIGNIKELFPNDWSFIREKLFLRMENKNNAILRSN